MTLAVVDAPVIYMREVPSLDDRLSVAAMEVKQRPDSDIPWWAIELLELGMSDPLFRARMILRYHRPRMARLWELFATLVHRAEETVMRHSIDEWRDLCYDDTDKNTGEGGRIAHIVRDAALFNPRAFCQLADLRDEEGLPITLKEFHLRMLLAMRCTQRPAMIQAFWGCGKTALSSTIVPLLDWAEWPSATEGRVYLDEDLSRKWTGRLMQIVEENDKLHRVFPWIAKPERGDPGHKIWGLDGFAIKGNRNKQRSFEGHTIGSSKTGFRFNRTGIDDVVNEKQAATSSIQDRNLNYIKAVVLTMRQRIRSAERQRSRYGTVLPGVYIVGTPYDRVDVNVRLEQEYREKGYKVVRIPIFIDDNQSTPRWPEMMTAHRLVEMREEMGTRAFNMRCRLMVGGRSHAIFPEAAVDWALKDGRADSELARWTVVPEHTKLIVGFDPGSGRRVQHHGARYPAYAVYGVKDRTWWRPPQPTASLLRDGGPVPDAPDLEHHVIEWGRLEGMGFTSQCQRIADLAHVYSCPVAVEDNGTQTSYGEELARIAPDVTIFTHTTSLNKRDPVQGVDQFESILANQRLVIHAAGAPADAVKALRDEMVGWPTWAFSDLVMALWIARHQFNLHVQVQQGARVVRPRTAPDYVRRFTGGMPSRWAGMNMR